MTSTQTDLASVVSLADFERLAGERMEPRAWDFLAGGAEDEITLAENVAAFRRRRLLPFVAALGVAGEAGVNRAFAILREELERAMTLLGTSALADVRRDHVLDGSTP